MNAILRVALPGCVGAGHQKSWAAALDVTPLLNEWALALLDPVEALRRVAPDALKEPGWDLTGKATVTPALMKLVCDAAADTEVVRAIESAIGPGRLTFQGACLLLGLAAVTALDANVGKASALVLADVRKRRAATASAEGKRERERSAPPEVRAEAARPTHYPIPPDAFGKDAL